MKKIALSLLFFLGQFWAGEISLSVSELQTLAALNGYRIENQPGELRRGDTEINFLDSDDAWCDCERSAPLIAAFACSSASCAGIVIEYLAPWPFSIIGNVATGIGSVSSAWAILRAHSMGVSIE